VCSSDLVEMQIKRASVAQEGGYDIFKADIGDVLRGNKELKPDEWITVEVRNLSGSDVYITLFDLQNNAKVTQLWPPLDPSRPVTHKLAKNQEAWHKLWTGSFNVPMPIQISPPYGVEYFKLIVTREDVDLSGLETRAARTPLERALKGAMSGARANLGATATDWATATVTINVVNAESNAAPKR